MCITTTSEDCFVLHADAQSLISEPFYRGTGDQMDVQENQEPEGTRYNTAAGSTVMISVMKIL